MTWTYKGTEYYASALISIVPGSQPSFEDGYHDSQGYHGVHADTGSFGSGPNGVVEIDVPKTNVGSPPAQAVLVQPAGVTYTGYGVPPNASGVYLVGQLQVDTGGPTNDFVVGSRCAQTLSSVQGVHRTQRQSTAAGGPLAQTGLLPIGVLAGLLLLLLGTGMAVRYRRSG
jgi:hypothetical protein